MKILITGGSGLLGQAIIGENLFSNDEFTILSRKKSIDLEQGRIQTRYWNPYALDGWEKILQGQDVIIHLAGQNIGNGFWSKNRKEQILASRVASGRVLQQAILKTADPALVFIQASAVGFYGSRGDAELTEHSPKGQGFLSDVCQQWEASTLGLESAGIRRIVLRTGVILSAQGGIYPRLALPIRAFMGGNLGNGRQYVPWLHIDDFPAIIHHLLHNSTAGGVFNLCAPQAVPLSTIGRTIAKQMYRPYWLPLPAFVIRFLLGEMSALVLDSQRVVPERLLASGYSYRYSNLATAIANFV